MKARFTKTVQLIDPEESQANEDPLWAPSWELPQVDRAPAEPSEEVDGFRAERDPLRRLGEDVEDGG